eukprot:434281-Amphidinium_carterae.1
MNACVILASKGWKVVRTRIQCERTSDGRNPECQLTQSVHIVREWWLVVGGVVLILALHWSRLCEEASPPR